MLIRIFEHLAGDDEVIDAEEFGQRRGFGSFRPHRKGVGDEDGADDGGEEAAAAAAA